MNRILQDVAANIALPHSTTRLTASPKVRAAAYAVVCALDGVATALATAPAYLPPRGGTDQLDTPLTFRPAEQLRGRLTARRHFR
jgi:hypothetical protein